MKSLYLMPLKKSANQTLAKTLSEPPCLKGEGKWTGAAEVKCNSTSLELGAGALLAHLDFNDIQLEGKGIFSLHMDKGGMTAKSTLTLIWEWYVCKKFQAFWDFFSCMGYTKHIPAALAISWVVVSPKPLETYVLPSSIFWSRSSNSAVCSTLSVIMWRQCLLAHMELISIDAINSIRIKSLILSAALRWYRSRGWVSTKAINHRQGVPPPWKPIWKVSSLIHCIAKPCLGQTQGWHWTPS